MLQIDDSSDSNTDDLDDDGDADTSISNVHEDIESMTLLSQVLTEESESTEEDGPQDPVEGGEPTLASLKIPKPYKITAQQINEVSFSRKTSKKRERRLRKAENATTKSNLDSLSDTAHVLKHAYTINEVDNARRHHRLIEDNLKDFETGKPRIKDLYTQRLRTMRAWAKIASHERRYIKEHVKKSQPAVQGNFYFQKSFCAAKTES